MAIRMSDSVSAKIVEAIKLLPAPQAVRDRIEWEATPALIPTPQGPAFAFMIAISVPLPDLGDWVLYSAPLEDPHEAQPVVDTFVLGLYQQCQQECDSRLRAIGKAATGRSGHHSAGGLILP